MWFPTKRNRNRSGCLTPAFSGAQKRAEMLHHPCILGGPQRQPQGGKSEVVPNKGVNKQKWLPHPCFQGGPKEGRNATSPLHSSGSPTPNAGRNIKSIPQQRSTQTAVATTTLPSEGLKRGRKCYLTPAFLGAQKWAEMLRHPCIIGCPQRQAPGAKSEVVPNEGVNKQKCLPHPCLLGGPKEGGNATSPLHSQGSPTPSAGRKIRSVPQRRGKHAKMVASPLPSRGPKRGRKCYVTPAFSGCPQRQWRRQIRSGP